MIKENIKKVLNDLKETDTKLIAVSKMQSIDKIKIAYDMGIRDFGENKVQELLFKKELLPSDIRWHMIGHLQTNKVKDIIDKVYLIHSVDSIKLANKINDEAKKKGIIVNVLLEINIANEDTKYGFDKNNIPINELNKLSNINIEGFMCVAPNTDNPNNNTIYFKEMNKLKNKYKYPILSMGMSNDYKEAIKEKSTYIRIGTKLFGPRI